MPSSNGNLTNFKTHKDFHMKHASLEQYFP